MSQYDASNVGMHDSAIAERIGVPTDMDLRREVADFYLLERLKADGSRSAARNLDAWLASRAPIFARFLSATAGGELRHVTSQREDGEGWCDGGGCCCKNCHEQCQYCGNEPDHPDHGECDCCPGCEDDDCSKEWDCDHHGLAPCGYDEREDSDWEANVPKDLHGFIRNAEGSGRTSAWEFWLQETRGNEATMLRHAARVFRDESLWNGGYGGEGWGMIAQVAADYYAGKISPLLFVDRCWTLEHNGGNVFNKLWGTESHVGSMLQHQSRDEYDGYLTAWASPENLRPWRSRHAFINNFHDYDAAWLGTDAHLGDDVEW